MFEILQNFWMPVLPVSELGESPVSVTLAGEKLVLFRTQSGEIRALRDRCSHRSAALSLGRVTPNGCIECPYHGWQFNGDGACVRVPFNDVNKINFSRLAVNSFPTQVIAGCVWIFTGEGKPPVLQIPDSLKLSETAYYIHQEIWKTHWTRAIEASLDFVHLPFVHRESFGQIAQSALESGDVLDLKVNDSGDRIEVFTPYAGVPPTFALEWQQPNLVMVKFDDLGFPVKREHFFAVPIDEHQTQCTIILQMAEGMDAQTQQFAAQEFIKPLVEDRVVVESQIGEIHAIAGECHVPTDKPTLLFRRWYHQTIARQLVLR
ncbi:MULTISPECIES: aromatic ring-hydroxylating oxygenase subunit alpha [Nostocales]|uniref:Aromatic ring-hydroxylating dioxygenase subunit alpha n=3 Tax=Nostocales TaxID=1161 RepID=A0A8S9TE23_9CYAN|nr:aromatic ring-hydroxylating dioxygenase subunit alpha [Tolypothrix bouteillei]KAF3889729.1 aromatic ring-hydroxylating dioxygenase subunit alpha [Tolypothrix bouteillei VB521301]